MGPGDANFSALSRTNGGARGEPIEGGMAVFSHPGSQRPAEPPGLPTVFSQTLFMADFPAVFEASIFAGDSSD
jgi:hypothetical protein